MTGPAPDGLCHHGPIHAAEPLMEAPMCSTGCVCPSAFEWLGVTCSAILLWLVTGSVGLYSLV